MKIGFYYSGKMNKINHECIKTLINLSDIMGLGKVVIFTHEKESYKELQGLSYVDAKLLEPWFLDYKGSLERKQWNRFSDLVAFFGAQIIEEDLLKFDTDIYINNPSFFANLDYSKDILFYDCDTRENENNKFLNPHITFFKKDSKMVRDIIGPQFNHAMYLSQNESHYNLTGPHYMNRILKPYLEFIDYYHYNTILHKPHNGYSKDLILKFNENNDYELLKSNKWDYVHLVGSQLIDWVGDSSNYNDRKNLYK